LARDGWRRAKNDRGAGLQVGIAMINLTAQIGGRLALRLTPRPPTRQIPMLNKMTPEQVRALQADQDKRQQQARQDAIARAAVQREAQDKAQAAQIKNGYNGLVQQAAKLNTAFHFVVVAIVLTDAAQSTHVVDVINAVKADGFTAELIDLKAPGLQPVALMAANHPGGAVSDGMNDGFLPPLATVPKFGGNGGTKALVVRW
jgi:hypothetical protein